MATINYSRTQIGDNLFIIEWAGLAAGDDGQIFEATNYLALSRHSYAGGGSSPLAFMNCSNESASPTHGVGVVSLTGSGVSSFGDIPKARWYWPVAVSGAGTVTAIILFQEI